MNEIHVCFSTDDNYAPYCGVAILSMFQNKNPDDQIYVYILYKDLTEESIEKFNSLAIPGECQVETVQISGKQFEDMPLPVDLHFTEETYYRFIIPRIFPDLDKMIYLDCDILVRKSLWELYNMEMRDFPLAMALDIGDKHDYYNAGVMLMNCRQWRRDDIEQALFEYAANNREQICNVDQDVLNGLLAGRILEIEKKWNRQIPLHWINRIFTVKEIVNSRDIHILHYLGASKPWDGFFKHAIVEEYFAYAKQVPWDIPDRTEEYRGLSWSRYYTILQGLKTEFKQKKISEEKRIFVLYETAVHKEIECAVQKLGVKSVKGHLIKSDEWKQKRWDFLIIEYHNIAIVDYILKKQGYDIEKEMNRYMLIPETSQAIDDDLLVSEYMEYVGQAENGRQDKTDLESTGCKEGKAEATEVMHVCLATDDQYAPYCGVAVLSMFENRNENDQIHVHILHKDLKTENINKLCSLAIPNECLIDMVQVCQEQMEDLPLSPTANFTIETYYRLMIPRIFSDIDKMLWLDCDILVKGSLRELYDIDMHGLSAAMVRDTGAETAGRGDYCNAGVMLINCSYWRKNRVEKTLYQYAEKNKEQISLADQDVINGLLASQIYRIDDRWNKQIAFGNMNGTADFTRIKDDRDIRILHYFGREKPWHGVYQNDLSDEYFGYMGRVPWNLPDKREMYKGLNEDRYYNALWRIRTCFNQGIISGGEKIIILHETDVHKEVEYAARDLGIGNVKGYLITSDGWQQEQWDFLIIEYHNLAIMDYTLKKHGYFLEKESGRYVRIPEIAKEMDAKALAAEFIQYLQGHE